MNELPSGPLVDQNGKKWIYENGNLIPHLERKPLFTDPCGNEVFEGERPFSARRDTGTIESWAFPADTGLTINYAEGNSIWSPAFKHKSDLEKWVASNVKTMTRKEALEMVVKEWKEYRVNKTMYSSFVFMDIIDNLIKETCL